MAEATLTLPSSLDNGIMGSIPTDSGSGILNLPEATDKLAKMGRKGDVYIAHLSEGETIVPLGVFDKNPEAKELLFKSIRELGFEPEQFIVGNELNSINPETGLPEFGIGSFIKRLVKKAAPIVGTVVGYMYGGPKGAAIGRTLGGKVKGESWGDALRRGITTGGMIYGSNAVFGSNPIQWGVDKWGASALPGASWAASAPYMTQMAEANALATGAGAGAGGATIQSGTDPIIGTVGSSSGIPATTVASEVATKTPFWKSMFMEEGKFSPWRTLGTVGMGGALLGGMAQEDTGQGEMEPTKYQNYLEAVANAEARGLQYGDLGYPTPEQFGVYKPPAHELMGGLFGPSVANKDYYDYANYWKNAPSATLFSELKGTNEGGYIEGAGTEKSDSIPALLSDGEFVFTAEAVRGAGNGDRRQGAQKMYNMMRQFEQVA
jgi:hypothetical protein